MSKDQHQLTVAYRLWIFGSKINLEVPPQSFSRQVVMRNYIKFEFPTSVRTIGLATLAGLLGACASSPPAPVVHKGPSTTTSQASREFYTVSRADTLTSIAQRFGVTVREIVEWNNLGASPVLQAGQVLRVAARPGAPVVANVPTSPTPAPEPSAQTAPVRPPAPVSPVTVTEAQRPAPKTGPRGTKRPYSDETLAQMSRGNQTVSVPATGTAPVAVTSSSVPPPPVAASPATNEAISETKADSSGLAWSWPAGGKVMQVFDGTRSRGMTLAGDPGKPVLAAAKGKVIFAKEFQDYGKLVIISHGPDLVSVYAQNNAISIREGQTVERGQKIAEQGPRVQFEVRRAAKAVDPAQFLPSR